MRGSGAVAGAGGPATTARAPAGQLRLRYHHRRALNRELHERGGRLALRTRLKASWVSFWFSAACKLQALQLVDGAQPPDPIFVCGFWRSGTTLLHELISCDSQFMFPTTAQCMDPARLTTRLRAGTGVARRPMDGLEVHAGSPQEDEFALLSLGLASVYETLLLPAGWRKRTRTLECSQWTPREVEAWSAGFQQFLRLLAVNDTRRVVLKSPTHSFRIDLLARAYSGAKFILLIRDPGPTFLSNLRLWRSLFDLYALESYEERSLHELVPTLYRILGERLASAAPQIDRRQLLVVPYEAVVRSPLQTMRQLYEHLGLPWSTELRDALWQRMRRNRSYRPRRYDGIRVEDIEGFVHFRETHARILETLGGFDSLRI